MASLPLVSSAYDMVSAAYASTKDSHPYMRSMCDVAEKGVKTLGAVAASGAQPLLAKLEPQSESWGAGGGPGGCACCSLLGAELPAAASGCWLPSPSAEAAVPAGGLSSGADVSIPLLSAAFQPCSPFPSQLQLLLPSSPAWRLLGSWLPGQHGWGSYQPLGAAKPVPSLL